MFRNSSLHILFFTFLFHNSFSQAIYKGGKSDGFSTSCYVQTSNSLLNIYSGGKSDGFATTCYVQSTNVLYDLYKGGKSDGFATTCYVQATNVLYDLYKGGNSDGFATTCYVQATNVSYDLYKGGKADGFATTCYVQATNVLYDLYKGGIQGGFAVTCVSLTGIVVSLLPIELTSFTGTCEKENIFLKWTTATEVNNDYFTIEYSPNNINWQISGTVAGAGNSLLKRNYSFTDVKQYNGILYYRLKQTDFDGKFNYFDIIALENCGDNSFELIIYPNPSNGKFTAQTSGMQYLMSNIEAYNVLGEKIYSTPINSDKTEIDISDQPNGIYFLKIKQQNKIASKKVTIIK